MQYRLIKSEPYKYSREQFVKDKTAVRDGVRSYEARNNLRTMKKWDICLRYHSNEWKEIVGIAKVSKTAYPDPSALWEKWDRVVVEVVPWKAFKVPVTLEYVKTDKQLSDVCLLRKQRLSVAPVTEKHYNRIISLGGL